VKFAGPLYFIWLYLNADKNGTVIPHVHGSFRIAFGYISLLAYIYIIECLLNSAVESQAAMSPKFCLCVFGVDFS
jgi:hypothetical protein